MTYEENGGDTCTGDSSERQDCNTGTCPQGTELYVIATHKHSRQVAGRV